MELKGFLLDCQKDILGDAFMRLIQETTIEERKHPLLLRGFIKNLDDIVGFIDWYIDICNITRPLKAVTLKKSKLRKELKYIFTVTEKGYNRNV